MNCLVILITYQNDESVPGEGVNEVLSILDQNCLEVMVTYAQRDFFPGPDITNMRLAVTSQYMVRALARMLELRLLRCDATYNPAPSTGQYAYHWTYLGRLAAKQLGIVN